MEKAPEEVSKDLDEEIKLPLINKFAIVDTEKQKSVDEIYEQMKENFRKILKTLPPQLIGDSVLDTLANANKHSKTLQEENKSDEAAKQNMAMISQIENSIPICEKGGKITKKLAYREILVDITKDLKDMKAIRAKQKREYDRLKENVNSLQAHQKYLQEKVDDFDKYLKDSTKKQFISSDVKKNQKNSNKKFKFSYSQLKKERSYFCC